MVRPLEPDDSALLGGDRHVDEPDETLENLCAPFYEAGWRAGAHRLGRVTDALRQLGISEWLIADVADGRTDIDGRVPDVVEVGPPDGLLTLSGQRASLPHSSRLPLSPERTPEQTAASGKDITRILTDALMRGPGRYSRSGSQALAERLLLALEDAGYVIGEARP